MNDPELEQQQHVVVSMQQQQYNMNQPAQQQLVDSAGQQLPRAKPKNTGTRLEHVPDLGGVQTAPPRKKRNRNRSKRPAASVSTVSSNANRQAVASVSVVSSSYAQHSAARLPSKQQQQEHLYARKYQLLKRSLRALVYKNAALCDEVARLHQRIATTEEDAKVIIRRLLHHERLRQRRQSNAIRRQNAREQRLQAQQAKAESSGNGSQAATGTDDGASNHSSICQSTMTADDQPQQLITAHLERLWRDNVVGPSGTEPDAAWLAQHHSHCTQAATCCASPSGVRLHPRVRNRPYLCAALHLCSELDVGNDVEVLLLQARVLRCHYKLLAEPCHLLRERMRSISERLLAASSSSSESTDVTGTVCAHLQLFYGCLSAQLFDAARQHLDAATGALRLTCQMSGALGKRTKFQENDIAQLMLLCHVDDAPSAGADDKYSTTSLPGACSLNDDTVLDGVRLADGNADAEEQAVRHSALVQAAVLAQAAHAHRVTSSDDPIRKENMRAYVEWLVRQASNWSVLYCTLVYRCRLERDERRRVERALQQIEQLSTDFADARKAYAERAALAFETDAPTVWQVDALQAEVLMSLGCAQEALRVYERLQMWSEMIGCYRQLGRTSQAEALIRQCLAEDGQQPLMYCYLGDITQHVDDYQQALQISSGRCHQAHRGLGMLWLARKQFDKAAAAFEACLAIQPLQYQVAYNLGYCEMQQERWEAAAHAYYQATSLEPSSADAWNNLSAAYLHMKTDEAKRKAFRILQQEAVRHNYDNWKIWENYLLVSTDLEEWQQCIRAYNRLIDLKRTYVDEAVLNNLSVAALELPGRIYEESLKLFGRLTSIVGNNASVWRSYANLQTRWRETLDEVGRDKYVRSLERAHAAALQTLDRNVDECVSVLRTYSAVLQADADRIANDSQRRAAVRMTLRSLLARVNKSYADTSDDHKRLVDEGSLPDLQARLAQLTN